MHEDALNGIFMLRDGRGRSRGGVA